MLDEPLAALDTDAADRVLSLIDARLSAGAVVVMTSHQPFTVAAELGEAVKNTLSHRAKALAKLKSHLDRLPD